jgi:hypothetical protein
MAELSPASRYLLKVQSPISLAQAETERTEKDMRTLMWGIVLIVIGVLACFVWRGRQERLAEEEAAKREALAKAAGKGVQDMRACAKCGAYVPASDAKSCGKEDCPVGVSLPKSESKSRSGGGSQG